MRPPGWSAMAKPPTSAHAGAAGSSRNNWLRPPRARACTPARRPDTPPDPFPFGMRPSVKDLAEKPVPTSPPVSSTDSVGEYEEPWRRGPPLRYGRLRTGKKHLGEGGSFAPPFPQEIPPLPLQDSFGLERQ